MKTMKKILSGIITVAMAFSIMSVSVFADETVETTATEESASETIDLSNESFETVYGSQLFTFLNHKYTFQGKEIPVEEVNFYFINAFLDLSNYSYYGYYPATAEGYIDLAAEMSENDKGYKTYADFFVEYASQGLASTYVILDRANKEGLKLSDETLAEIDSMFTDLEENGAKKANMTIDEYIQLYYGPTCTKEVFRTIIENYYLMDLYTEKYCENYKSSEAAPSKIPNIRYALFYAPDGSSDEDLKAAETAAKDLLSKATSLDVLKTEAESLNEAGTVYETGDIGCAKGATVSNFDAWAWDSSRKEGDIAVIFTEEYGYFVVGYLGLTDADEDEINEAATQALNDEITKSLEDGTYTFKTDDTFEPAVAVPTAASTTNMDDITVPTGDNTTDNDGKSQVISVLTIVFAVLGVISLIAVIVLLIMYFVKKNKNTNKNNEDVEIKEIEEVKEVEEVEEDTASSDEE